MAKWKRAINSVNSERSSDMSRMTCVKGLVLVAATCLGLMAGSTRGGNLAPAAGPESADSAMWTLENIYNVLDTRTTNVTRRTGAFTEPNGGPTNGTMHTLNDIMTLATNRAPVPKTGQTLTYKVGDDGTNRVGVAWPNPRFTVLGDTNAPSDVLTNCVRDNLTGLIWARNANIASNSFVSVNGTCTWDNAYNIITNAAGPVNGANYGGTNDWRMPSICEFRSLMDYGKFGAALPAGHPFFNTLPQGGVFYHWSSTTYAFSTASAWVISIYDGSMASSTKVTTTRYVWPVRGGR